ncbi:MAG: nucleoside-diphosphate sugar epimerase/dehydratase [Mariprofundaceae bacterium]|nr:nucleoside-diphosphate sugar epimerase/dehydratase [Mariprofundaceae bacterium]
MLGFDALALPLALWLSYCLRYGDLAVPDWQHFCLFLSIILVATPVFFSMGLYKAIVHYMEDRAFLTVFKAVTLTTVLWSTLLLLIDPHAIPRASVIIFWMLALLLITGSRLWIRYLFISHQKQGNRQAVAIYGAGTAGHQLASLLEIGGRLEPVAFIDDDAQLHGHLAVGLPIYHSGDMGYLFESESISQVLVAIPSATQTQKKAILRRLEIYPVQVRILPRVEELVNCTVKPEQLREVSMDDLLGRDIATPNINLLTACICGKVVMVTGAGGSIGAELCQQVIMHQPKALLLFERNEFSLYNVEHKLRQYLSQNNSNIPLYPLLGSVVDAARVEQTCAAFGVDTLYHAAAYKHVPLVEFNPAEAVRNNIMGTLHTAQAAKRAGVRHFVLISTDKAVRPTNVMGATKRCAEMVLQSLSVEYAGSQICFSMVRFGNVLGSSGSVVPLFRAQINDGGPVTVTHPEITRYFMSIPEASQLVIQAGAMADGGDVFILDMGDPVRIVDLAKKMIHLKGLTVRDDTCPDGDISIQFTGLRPGEKLYEELLISDTVMGTEHPLIMRAKDDFLPWQRLSVVIKQMEQSIDDYDMVQLRALLLASVNGYHPQCGIKDLVSNACKKHET